MAYVLGFIASDGNICKSGRAHALHIACDDRDVIEKIKTVLSYEGPIYNKPRDNGKISYSLRICDPIIFKDLQSLNITERKSLTLIPPKIPTELLKDFIRGYFDGDGSVSLRNSHYPKRVVVDIYTASLSMAKFLHKNIVIVTMGHYEGNIRIAVANQKTLYYAIRLGHQAGLMLFDYMYQNATIYMERKYQKFIEGMMYEA